MGTDWHVVLWPQFGAAIDMLGNALEACPETLWRAPLWHDPSESRAYAEFWYLTFHTLFWLDLYLSGTVEGFAPPAPFTLNELDPAGLLPDRPYTKEELHGYLAHCRTKGKHTLDGLTAARAARRCKFGWGEVSFVESQLNNMRHVQEHAAQLALFLGQRVGWSPG